ncbi:hypothetical protein C8J57DRAFT_1624759 [Mycena rebaudengoi]|nr:hypothetical protein C8J57DRAFT_1624759 [Mycena rebaudengoi]
MSKYFLSLADVDRKEDVTPRRAEEERRMQDTKAKAKTRGERDRRGMTKNGGQKESGGGAQGTPRGTIRRLRGHGAGRAERVQRMRTGRLWAVSMRGGSRVLLPPPCPLLLGERTDELDADAGGVYGLGVRTLGFWRADADGGDGDKEGRAGNWRAEEPGDDEDDVDNDRGAGRAQGGGGDVDGVEGAEDLGVEGEADVEEGDLGTNAADDLSVDGENDEEGCCCARAAAATRRRKMWTSVRVMRTWWPFGARRTRWWRSLCSRGRVPRQWSDRSRVDVGVARSLVDAGVVRSRVDVDVDHPPQPRTWTWTSFGGVTSPSPRWVRAGLGGGTTRIHTRPSTRTPRRRALLLVVIDALHGGPAMLGRRRAERGGGALGANAIRLLGGYGVCGVNHELGVCVRNRLWVLVGGTRLASRILVSAQPNAVRSSKRPSLALYRVRLV